MLYDLKEKQLFEKNICWPVRIYEAYKITL